ncbi:hypothetical protein B0H12DRAFT_1180061 [Mycena haematopus]|nr:hypothetical protein B0H12DRAFT_1180061 [Mycena haematopus]
MPPRTNAKIYQVLIKTHKLTILTTVAPTISVAALKAEVLSALTDDVNTLEDVPRPKNVRDFELCRAVKDRGKPTGEYHPLEDGQAVAPRRGRGELGAAVRPISRSGLGRPPSSRIRPVRRRRWRNSPSC